MEPSRQDDTALQTILDKLEELGPVSKEGDSYRALCPLHEGRSLIVSPGKEHPVVMTCMGGNDCSTELILQRLGLSFSSLMAGPAERGGSGHGRTAALPSEKRLQQWCQALHRELRIVNWLQKNRGWSWGTIKKFLIGWDGERVVIPIRVGGAIANVRSYSLKLEPKMKGLQGHGTQLWILDEQPADTRNAEWILLCEGELDALLASQHGLPAATTTGGALAWKAEWSTRLAELHVGIAYDCDQPGRRGALKIAQAIRSVAKSVRIIDLGLGEGEDITDWFVTYGRNAEDLRALIRQTPEFRPGPSARLVNGEEFVFGGSDEIEILWGRDDEVLWAAHEGLMIVGPQAVGKTTIAQQLLVARLEIRDATFLGLPVAPERGKVLYLAMDRPVQAARSLKRMVRPEEHRQRLRERLVVWKGPLGFDVVKDPNALADFTEENDATTLVVDSLKDLAPGLAQDEVGAGVNRAFQEAIARGIQLLVIHHQRKAQADNKRPVRLDDTFGSTWLTAGMGSVILLWGRPGSSAIELIHLKQPIDEVGPLLISHKHQRGISRVRNEEADLQSLLERSRSKGVTEAEVAEYLFGTDDSSARKRATRRLEKVAGEGTARYVPGTKGGKGGGGTPARWYLADADGPMPEGDARIITEQR